MFVSIVSLLDGEYEERHKRPVQAWNKSKIAIRYNGRKTPFNNKRIDAAREDGSLIALKTDAGSALFGELVGAFGRPPPMSRTTFFLALPEFGLLEEILARYPDVEPAGKDGPKASKKVARPAWKAPLDLSGLVAAANSAESLDFLAAFPLAPLPFSAFGETASAKLCPVAREIEFLLAKKKRDIAEIVAHFDSMIEAFGGAKCVPYNRKTIEEDRDRKISYIVMAYEARFNEISGR